MTPIDFTPWGDDRFADVDAYLDELVEAGASVVTLADVNPSR